MPMMWSDQANNGHLVIANDFEFDQMRSDIARRLLMTEAVNYGKWQQLDISASDAHATHELLNLSVWYNMPFNMDSAQRFIEPDLPWAEAHFQERVGGEAINPGVQHAYWPYHASGADLHIRTMANGKKYDHNYMERIWPTDVMSNFTESGEFQGYRFSVGDLNDVVDQLRRDPGTRQAYLPIWFPEDTGATEGQRVPCTLGYHFIIRDNKLHVQYNMRSCEIYRHFTNDVYMAVRLAQWVINELGYRQGSKELTTGQLTMNIVSMHGFKGDNDKIQEFIL